MHRWKHFKNYQWWRSSWSVVWNNCRSEGDITHCRRSSQRKRLIRIGRGEEVLHYRKFNQNLAQHGTSPISGVVRFRTQPLFDTSFKPLPTTRNPRFSHNYWIHLILNKCVWGIEISIATQNKENLPDWIVWWRRQEWQILLELPQKVQFVCSS